MLENLCLSYVLQTGQFVSIVAVCGKVCVSLWSYKACTATPFYECYKMRRMNLIKCEQEIFAI